MRDLHHQFFWCNQINHLHERIPHFKGFISQKFNFFNIISRREGLTFFFSNSRLFQQIFLLEETKLYYNGKEFEAKVIKKRLILSNQSVEGSISLEIFPSHLAFTYSTSMLTVLENYACITKCGVLFFKDCISTPRSLK